MPGLRTSAPLQLAARIPIDPETQNIPITSRYHQQPKWYQFIPRILLNQSWLEGLLPDEPPYNIPRKGLIIADEGGVGKTKAAALCINHIFCKNPEKSILLLVPSRLIMGWRNEIKRVNPNLQGDIEIISNAKKIRSISKGKIIITSKDSFSKNSEEIFEYWNKVSIRDNYTDNEIFSLVVIDEAHKGKKNDGNHDADIGESNTLKSDKKKKWAIYKSIKKLCNNYSEKNLAVTASPLSMELSDIRDIAEMIGVDDLLLESINPGLDEESNEKLLEDWKQYIEEFREVSEPLKSKKFSNNDLFEFFEFFSEDHNKKKIQLLPYHEQLINTMKIADETAWKDFNKRMGWINELNPYSAFLSIIKRQDLGKKSNELFRTRFTWTEYVKLHPDHMKRIEQLENPESIGRELRQIHEWPTNDDYNGKKGDYTSEGINFDEISSDNIISEPRLNRIVNSIFPKDPVLSGNYDGNKGALIFCFHKRTVRIIAELLNKQNIILEDGSNVKIIAHSITSENENSMELLRELGESHNQKEGAYNVVVGTSAIQEGISLNWMSTVVHWDLPPNPQTLEQRTWRLDRHRTEIDSDVFNIVYIVSDSKSDKRLVDRILSRAKTADIILGHDHNPEQWPSKFLEDFNSDGNKRIYSGSENKFFYAESIELAKAWNHAVDSSNIVFKIRTEQQKQLFINILREYNLPINFEKIMEDGVIEFKDWDVKSIKTLQRLLFYADGNDLVSLQRCYPVFEGRKNILSIDGFNNESEQKGRIFAISIDPKGNFIRKILRRVEENKNCIAGSSNAEPTLIFSIETKEPIFNYEDSFESLYNEINPGAGSLFIVENFDEKISVGPLIYDRERFDLFETILKKNQSSNETLITTNQSEIAKNEFKKLLNGYEEELEQQINNLEKELDDLEDQIKELEDNIFSGKDERILELLNQRKKVKETEYNKLDFIQQNVNDSLFYPVVRYVQGGI